MAAQRRERKVVTVVFCDLVGFTGRAEQLDPEDVEALLGPYHERLRSELERHGGTVEKFIGDAVMALFGAPVAHEDDPERAVRACLAIRDWAVEEDDVQVRIAVTTGEALIRLDARPEAGEGMASGDVVNTAARLQSAAPVNGILADETTYRATRQTIEYGEAPAVEAKGKSQPVSAWQVLDARARFGVDVAHEARTELVGRERELSILRDAFARARHEQTPQLVTLVGVPGLGKSRLVYELSRIVDADPELITWRQGRCLAYGGVTLWALGEIVKAQVGILEQDTADEVSEKVHRAVKEVLPNEKDTAWVEPHLLTLVGQADESELGGDRRGAAFAAWRRFLEALAEQRPLVLVFEDLHWADESLLDFVDELVDWVSDVPLLIVATSRPELLERRPGWGGGKLNATTLALAPLSNDETASLIARLLERSVLPVESQQALLERAGGNPLYAEQFADLYVERGSAEDLPLPETLQGIISARLDVLPASEKGLLRDAAVVGKVFWADVLQREPGIATAALHSLERKGFVRRQKRSSVEGEDEFAFAHALVRDVAYGQIARADRAEKHRRTAEWIDTLGRTEDHAEMLAYHWRSALEFARAAGQEVDDIADRARIALREAGDRAFALNSYPAAERYYADALELWPNQDPERPDLLFRRAHSLYVAGDDRREQALERARDALLEAGDRDAAAEAEALLARALWERGRRDEADAHLHDAEQLVVGGGRSAAKTRVLAVTSRLRMLAEELDTGLRLGEEALAMAEALSLDELRAHALGTIGLTKVRLGDPTGIHDLELSVEIALAANSPVAAGMASNLGVAYWERGDTKRWRELVSESRRLAERFGDTTVLRLASSHEIQEQFLTGGWAAALTAADEFITECEAGSPHFAESLVRRNRGSLRLARGESNRALDDFERSLALGREARDPLRLMQALKDASWAHAALGRLEDARQLAEELLALARVHSPELVFYGVCTLSPVAEPLGIAEAMREVVERARPSPWRDAELAVLTGDVGRAAEIFAVVGYRTREAEIRLLAAERMIEAGRRAEGEAELERALAFYRSVGATFYIRRGEALLAKSA